MKLFWALVAVCNTLRSKPASFAELGNNKSYKAFSCTEQNHQEEFSLWNRFVKLKQYFDLLKKTLLQKDKIRSFLSGKIPIIDCISVNSFFLLWDKSFQITKKHVIIHWKNDDSVKEALAYCHSFLDSLYNWKGGGLLISMICNVL